MLYIFERNFAATCCTIRMTADEKSVMVEVEMPEDHVKLLDNCVKDGKINMEIDKIHGIDPAMNRRDVNSQLAQGIKWLTIV